jgi:hypothetical protein
MIAHFPDPYPGELLYSVFARFSERMCYPSLGATLLELFGKRYAVPAIELPNQLDGLISRLPQGHGYTADQLIDKHTLFPLYAAFVRREKYEKLRDNMKGDAVRTTHVIAGINACRVPSPETLRTCPICDKENIEKFGETYWHRVHQVSGVEACPFHAVFLEPSNVRRSPQEMRHSFISAEAAERSTTVMCLDHAKQRDQVLLKIAKLAAELLDVPPDPLFRTNLRDRYLATFREHGLTRLKSGLRVTAAREKLLRFCPADLLELLNCEVPTSKTYSGWLGALVHAKQQTLAPIRHLLAIAWLNKPLNAFLNAAKIDDPLRVTFPCLNCVCDWFQKNVTNSIEFRASKRISVLRIYRCPHCLHASSRTDNWARIIRVIDFGSTWSNQLRSLWSNRTVSLSEIRRKLGADPTTIRRRAAALGLPFPRVYRSGNPVLRPACVRGKVPSESERAAKKAKWVALRGRPRLKANAKTRKIHDALYGWLRKHEAGWLKVNSLRGNRQTPQTEFVNWPERDEGLASRIPDAVLKIKARANNPRRISFTRLGRELGMLATIQAKPEKFPKTLQAISEVSETREQFALRRLETAVDHFIGIRLIPNWSELTKRAGINSSLYGRFAIADSVRTALIKVEIAILNQPLESCAA